MISDVVEKYLKYKQKYMRVKNNDYTLNINEPPENFTQDDYFNKYMKYKTKYYELTGGAGTRARSRSATQLRRAVATAAGINSSIGTVVSYDEYSKAIINIEKKLNTYFPNDRNMLLKIKEGLTFLPVVKTNDTGVQYIEAINLTVPQQDICKSAHQYLHEMNNTFLKKIGKMFILNQGQELTDTRTNTTKFEKVPYNFKVTEDDVGIKSLHQFLNKIFTSNMPELLEESEQEESEQKPTIRLKTTLTFQNLEELFGYEAEETNNLMILELIYYTEQDDMINVIMLKTLLFAFGIITQHTSESYLKKYIDKIIEYCINRIFTTTFIEAKEKLYSVFNINGSDIEKATLLENLIRKLLNINVKPKPEIIYVVIPINNTTQSLTIDNILSNGLYKILGNISNFKLYSKFFNLNKDFNVDSNKSCPSDAMSLWYYIKTLFENYYKPSSDSDTSKTTKPISREQLLDIVKKLKIVINAQNYLLGYEYIDILTNQMSIGTNREYDNTIILQDYLKLSASSTPSASFVPTGRVPSFKLMPLQQLVSSPPIQQSKAKRDASRGAVRKQPT